MAYKYQYYKPEKPYKIQQKGPFVQKIKRLIQRKWKKVPQRVALVLLVLVLAISASEALGGPLPTWRQVYEAFGLVHMPHLSEEAKASPTKIHFIDVGQANATLIEQDGAFCLIDAGGLDVGNELIAYLKEAGVKQLEWLVMTHPHSDHIGSMVAVLEAFDVQQVLLPDFSKSLPPNTYTILRTLELIDVQGIPTYNAAVGDVFALGSGTITVLGAGVDTKDYNNACVMTLFEASGVRFLSGGDAESEQWNATLDAHTNLAANVYAAAHHGSGSANKAAWLREILPKIVVVSCGRDNDYGHPHLSSLENFSAIDAVVYRTDENGSVVVYVDAQQQLQTALSRIAA